jgi:hypothetical protein
MATKYIRDTKAAQAIDVYVIMKGARHVATVQAYWSALTLLVNVWHPRGACEMQRGKASGYGYDKFTAALSGLVIDGHTMADHCGKRLKPPRGKTYFPTSYKPPRGYRLTNYGLYDAQGKRWPAFNLGDTPEGALTPGYSDCFKESGLNYLTALGYTVIEGI